MPSRRVDTSLPASCLRNSRPARWRVCARFAGRARPQPPRYHPALPPHRSRSSHQPLGPISGPAKSGNRSRPQPYPTRSRPGQRLGPEHKLRPAHHHGTVPPSARHPRTGQLLPPGTEHGRPHPTGRSRPATQPRAGLHATTLRARQFAPLTRRELTSSANHYGSRSSIPPLRRFSVLGALNGARGGRSISPGKHRADGGPGIGRH